MSVAFDPTAVSALADEQVTWRDKALPACWWGSTVAEVVAARPRLSDLPTPLFTLSAPGLAHNVATMARWCADRGLDLAPHGKTTMAPALWAAQLAAGSWALTLANTFQLSVARAFGVRRVLLANAVVSPLHLRRIADELAADPGFEVLVWADSVRTVQLIDAARASYVDAEARPLDVLVEVGGAAGRTGARDVDSALAVARAIEQASTLRLAGVAGYEGAIAQDTTAAGLAHVRAYLRGPRRRARPAAGRRPVRRRPGAGGQRGRQLVLRPGG
jgi:D-serine deaminase-like pyridoxal phosphate-dependent protein